LRLEGRGGVAGKYVGWVEGVGAPEEEEVWGEVGCGRVGEERLCSWEDAAWEGRVVVNARRRRGCARVAE
jgi:hypothetical protein